MNNEFSNCIKVALLSDVEKIDQGGVILKAGKNFETFYAADFSLDPQTQEGKSSLLHTIVKSLYIDKVPDEAGKLFSVTRRCVIQFDISGRPFILGSMSYPALAYITPHLQAAILKISHKSPEPYKL